MYIDKERMRKKKIKRKKGKEIKKLKGKDKQN